MADSFVSKLITELTAKTTAADTDLVPVADSNGNFFKMTWLKLKQLLLGTKDISGVGDGTVTGAISELNTNSIGYNQMAYVTFAPFGDNWWISSPVPCYTADKFNIRLSDNIKNSTSNNKSEISQTLFEVRKYKNYFYILTNDTSVAGYTFGTVHPGIVWEVYFSVIKS